MVRIVYRLYHIQCGVLTKPFFKDIKSTTPLKPPLRNLIEQDGSGEKKKTASEEEAEKQREREASWRTMKLTLTCFGLSIIVGGGMTLFNLGQPPRDEDGNLQRDDYSDMWTVKQYFFRTINELYCYTQVRCLNLRNLCVLKCASLMLGKTNLN